MAYEEEQELIALVAPLCAEFRKIAAIKVLRDRTGWGIKECKDFVDLHFPPGPPVPSSPEVRAEERARAVWAVPVVLREAQELVETVLDSAEEFDDLLTGYQHFALVTAFGSLASVLGQLSEEPFEEFPVEDPFDEDEEDD